MRTVYAQSLYLDANAKLDDLREAVTMLEDTARTARLVLGGSNPLAIDIENDLQNARAALRAHSLLPFGAFAVAVAVVAWIWRFFFA